MSFLIFGRLCCLSIKLTTSPLDYVFILNVAFNQATFELPRRGRGRGGGPGARVRKCSIVKTGRGATDEQS